MSKNILVLILLLFPVLLYSQYTNIGEVGVINSVSNEWVTVNLRNVYYSNYIVIARPVSYNDADPVIVRITNKTTNSFSVRLTEPSCNDNIHSSETVSFFVIKEGVWILEDGTKIEAELFDTSDTVGRGVANVWHSVSFSHKYSDTPVVLSMVQTHNDANYVTTRHRNLSTAGFDVAMEEEEDKTTSHGLETIGWIAVSPTHGNNAGKAYEAYNTPDAVSSSWYNLNFVSSFSLTPEFFCMMATYDGPDNAHMRYNSKTETNVQIKVEEDTCNDSETSHTTEIVSYLLWEQTTNIKALTGGYMSISLGDNTPFQNLSQNQENQEILQLKVIVGDSEDFTNVSLTLNANGSGDDSNVTISNVKLWLDADRNGQIDSSVDIKIDTNRVYNSDNGVVTFSLGTLTNSREYDFLVSYDLYNAVVGSTYYIIVSNSGITGTGTKSGNSPIIIGGPVEGAHLTVINDFGGAGIGEVGRLNDFATNVWRRIALVNIYTNPVVVVSVGSFNEDEPCVARVSNVVSNSFMVKIQEPANQDGLHLKETINYMVVEKGIWVLPDGSVIEAGKTNISNTVGYQVSGGSWVDIHFKNNFSSVPIVVSSVMSVNDSHFVKTRHNGVYSTNFFIALEEAEADSDQHAVETVSYIAMTSGTGVHYNIKYESERTPDLVTDSFYNQSFSQSYYSVPIVINSMNTYDGNNNAETRISDPGISSFNVKIEEDTTYDSEVAHTTEVVDYIAWESPGVIYSVKGNAVFVSRGESSPANNLLGYGNNQTIFQVKLRTGSKENITNVKLTLTAAGSGDDASDVISTVQIYTDVNRNGYYDSGIDGFVDSGTYNGDNGTVEFDLGTLLASSTNFYIITYNINGADNGSTFCAYINYDGITGTGSTTGEDIVGVNLPATSYTLQVSGAAGMGIGEVGVLLNWVNTNWQTVKFHRYYTNAVIVAAPVSFNESDPVAVRIRNVTGTNFQLRLQEPSNNDQTHVNETVSYIVVEKGIYTMPDGKKIIADKFDTNITCGDTDPGQNYASVNFGYTFSSVPSVLHQVMSFNDPQWVKTRANGSTTTGFQVALEEEENQTGYHGTETIGWIAIESGTGNNNGILYEAGRTSTDVDEIWFTQNFSQIFSSPSVFLGVLDTVNGTDPCNCRYRNLTKDSVELLGQEDTSADTEQNHNNEIVAYAVFESPGDIIGTGNPPCSYVVSSYSNFFTNVYIEANQKNVNLMRFYFENTNSNANDIQITGIYIHTETMDGSDIVPSSAVESLSLIYSDGSNVYTENTNIATSGSEIFLDLYPGNLIISPNSSVTCNVVFNVVSNVSATNIRFSVVSNIKIEAMDVFYSSEVTNIPASGYAFPFNTDAVDIVSGFKISHDTIGIINKWEPVEIRIENFNGSLVTNYTGIVTLEILNSVSNEIMWSNSTGNGILNDGGTNDNGAVYEFVNSDNGIVTLFVMDKVEDLVDVKGKDSWISFISNNLRFVPPDINVSIIKMVDRPEARPYEILTYKIFYSNTSYLDALDFSFVESLPEQEILITNSAEISNIPHSGNVEVYYSTNYNVEVWSNSNYDTASNVSKIRRIKWKFDTPLKSHQKGLVRFQVQIK